jgi:glycosyltransferase 2 family protein
MGSLLPKLDYRFPGSRCKMLSLEPRRRACHNSDGKDLPLNENRPSRVRRWLATAIKLMIVAIVLWYVRRTLVDAWDELGKRPWQFDFGWLAASGGMYLLGTLWCAVFWHRTLRALGQPVGLWQAIRAYYIGQLGKYVPGKAMVVILRAGLVRGPGVDTSLAAVSVFFETLTMMSTGALMAAAMLAVWFRGQPLLFWAAMGMMLAAGLPTLPPVFRRLVRLVGVGRTTPAVAEKLANLGYGTMLLGWVLTGLGWAILGLSFWAMLRGLGAADANPLPQLHLFTTAITLAMVAGFVSFVPGGAVVREAVLTELMVPYLGDTVSLVGAVLLRLVWLVAELVISGILYCTYAIRRHSSS